MAIGETDTSQFGETANILHANRANGHTVNSGKRPISWMSIGATVTYGGNSGLKGQTIDYQTATHFMACRSSVRSHMGVSCNSAFHLGGHALGHGRGQGEDSAEASTPLTT